MTRAVSVALDGRHRLVMLDEVLTALAPRAGGVYVDGTFGAGGYSRGLLDAADCTVVAIDRDPDAISEGKALADRYRGRLQLHHGRFGDMDAIVTRAGHAAVQGVALDLGVSSMQIDRADRGFSFRADGPLDMRMDRSGSSAADLVNTADEADLADIIWRFGDERRSRRVAKAIVMARRENRIETTSHLAEIVRRAVGRSEDGIDPATRTFQALRIAVNDELEEVRRGRAAPSRRRPDGRGRVPLSRGSCGEGLPAPPQRERAQGFASSARRRGGYGADLPSADPPPHETDSRRDQRQPACTLCAHAGCRTHRRRRLEGRDMIWRTTALCVLLAAAGGSALLVVTREVRERERTYARLQTQISEAREAGHVLRAEWAYLNRLERVRELSTLHLGMEAVTPDRIVRFEDLPLRPTPPAPELLADSRGTKDRMVVRLERRQGR